MRAPGERREHRARRRPRRPACRAAARRAAPRCRRRAPGRPPPSTELRLAGRTLERAGAGHLVERRARRRRKGSAAASGSPDAAATSRRGAAASSGAFAQRPRSLRPATCAPTRRSRRRSTRASRRLRAPGARAGVRARSRSARSTSIHSPCARCHSTPPSGHSNRPHPELRALRGFPRGLHVGGAEDHERRVAEEHEPAAGPKQPGRLGDPAVRIGPDRRAVLGQGEVEALGRQSRLGRIRLDERELDPCLGHHPTRRLELRRGDVDAYRASAVLREPRREVRGAAAELDDVEPGDVTEHFSSDSSIDQMPQTISSSAQFAAPCRPCTRRSPRSRERVAGASTRASSESIGEPEPDLALRRLGRVRAVNEVVRHRQRVLRRGANRATPPRGSWRRSSGGRSRSRPRPRARTRASDRR